MFARIWRNWNHDALLVKMWNNGPGALENSFTVPQNIKPRVPSVKLVAQLCLTLCDTMDCSMPAHHQLWELAQTHVHQVHDAIQPSHPLSPPSPAFRLCQHQGFFQWVSSSHLVVIVLELQHQSLQWIFRIDFL